MIYLTHLDVITRVLFDLLVHVFYFLFDLTMLLYLLFVFLLSSRPVYMTVNLALCPFPNPMWHIYRDAGLSLCVTLLYGVATTSII